MLLVLVVLVFYVMEPTGVTEWLHSYAGGAGVERPKLCTQPGCCLFISMLLWTCASSGVPAWPSGFTVAGKMSLRSALKETKKSKSCENERKPTHTHMRVYIYIYTWRPKRAVLSCSKSACSPCSKCACTGCPKLNVLSKGFSFWTIMF